MCMLSPRNVRLASFQATPMPRRMARRYGIVGALLRGPRYSKRQSREKRGNPSALGDLSSTSAARTAQGTCSAAG